MNFKYKYFLKIAAIGRFPELEISKKEHDEIVIAKRTLTAALSIEEKFDHVLGNFLDLEKELLMLGSEKTEKIGLNYKHAYTITATLNRRIVNFVISGRNYTESIANKASKCSPNSEEIESSATAFIRKQYDESLDYRLMQALRNHVSHSGGAVHLLSSRFTKSKAEANSPKQNIRDIQAYALKERLAENTGFKSSTLKELPDKIDLIKAARSYADAISIIQEEIRRLTKESIDKSRLLIESHLSAYAEKNNGNSFAVGAYSAALHKLSKKPTMLFLEWDNVRIELSIKNQSASNILTMQTIEKIK